MCYGGATPRGQDAGRSLARPAVLTCVSLYTFSKAAPAATIRTCYAMGYWSALPELDHIHASNECADWHSYFPK